MTLRASISYAVCEKLCIPVEAQAELAFVSVASTEDGNFRGTRHRAGRQSGRRGSDLHGEVRREGNVVQVEIAVQDDKPPAGKEKDVQLLSKVNAGLGATRTEAGQA